MMDLLYFVLGITLVVCISAFLYARDFVFTPKVVDTLECKHDWERWSRLYEAGDFLVQDRYCDKCNVAEVHRVRVR